MASSPRTHIRHQRRHATTRHGIARADARERGGEYLAIVALRDGSIGVVSPIQNRATERMGFTWWRYK
jgi:hypothetical protein